jgi:hypothetical protein
MVGIEYEIQEIQLIFSLGHGKPPSLSTISVLMGAPDPSA